MLSPLPGSKEFLSSGPKAPGSEEVPGSVPGSKKPGFNESPASDETPGSVFSGKFGLGASVSRGGSGSGKSEGCLVSI